MGVYIAGMKMPKNCEKCPCSYWTEGVHHDYCQAVGYDAEIHYGEKDRPQWCPLTEVPEPHGNLIDREELHYIIEQLSLNWEYGQGISDCWDAFFGCSNRHPGEYERQLKKSR